MLVMGYFSVLPAWANYPIFSQRFTADPSPIIVDGRVYVFCSHDVDGQTWWSMNDFTCISSDDLVNWTDHGEVFDAKRDTKWADACWAPQVVGASGKYYLYYTTGIGAKNVRGQECTGVAVADHILGPYKDPLGQALVTRCKYSDPTVLVDDQGQAYLYINGPRFAPLNPDMISLKEPLRPLDGQFPHFMEGPWITKINGRYNFSYSTSKLRGYGYSYAQSVGDHPDRDFVSKGLWFWMASDNVPNTHGGIFHFADKDYMVYQNSAVAKERGRPMNMQRSTCIDRVYFRPDGTLLPFTSTRDEMAQVKYVNPYLSHPAAMMARESGIETEPCAEGGRSVRPQLKGAWTKVQGVDFGNGGVSTFTARVSGGAADGAIELRLDGPEGQLIGSCPVTGCVSGQWTTVTCEARGFSELHDLYFRFTGGAGRMLAFSTWQFSMPSGGQVGTAVPPQTITKLVRVKCGNSRYVRLDERARLVADGATPQDAYTFRLQDNQDGTWSLRSKADGKYVRVVGEWSLDGEKADVNHRFYRASNVDGSWCMGCEHNGMFARLNGAAPTLVADFSEKEKGASPTEVKPNVGLRLLGEPESGGNEKAPPPLPVFPACFWFEELPK